MHLIRRYGICAVLAAILTVSTSYAQQRTLSLEDALEEAMSNNPTILREQYGLIYTNQASRELRASNLPAVALTTSIGRVGEAPTVPVEFDDGRKLIQLGSEYSFRTRLELEQKVFDFGKTSHRLEAARYAEAAQRATVEGESNQMSILVREQFYRVLHYTRLDSLYASIVGLNEQLERISDVRFKEGAILEPDLLRAYADVQLAAARQAEAQSEIAKGLMSLAKLMGLDRPDFELVGTLPDYTQVYLPESTVELLSEKALASRPDVRQLNYQSMQQAELTRAIDAQLRPSLAFQADLSYYGPRSLFGEFSSFGGQGLRTYNWHVGLAFRYPLFDGHRTRAQKEQSLMRMEQIEQQSRQLELDVRTELEIAVNDLRRLQSVFRGQTSLHAVSRANLALGETQFRNGALPLIAFIELTIADTNNAILVEQQVFEITRLFLMLESITGHDLASTPVVTTE